MKKRILAILLCLFMLALLCACTAEDGEPSSSVPGESTIASSSEVSEEISIEESSILEEASLPEVSQPDESEPEISEPEESQPEISEPEVSEPEVSDPPTLELPPEEELSMELVDEIPVNDPRSPIFLQYNIGESFYGQIITPTRFLVDLNGDIYCVVGVGIFRLRDSAGFRLIDPNDTGDRSVSSVAVYNGTIYVAYKSFSGQKGELVAYDITGKVLSSAALPAAKYGEYYYLFISEDGKPKVLFGNDIYSHTGQKVGVLNAEADVTYGVTIGGVTHSMTNEPLILSRLGGVSTIREIQEKWYGTDPAKRHCIREEIFHQYDKAGNLVSEFKLTEFSCGKDIPCHVAIGEAVCTSVSLETVTIGENVFEGVYSCRVVPGADGKLYAILIYTDGTRIYRIDPGYSEVEFRDLNAIENPKAECLICKAPAPAEKETTLEKVFTFDIGPNGVMEYNFFFEDDPS
ncbi:MAG: hypothetical protein J6S15_04335, partial [Clostridia bacterium]|nr:hypothetical protein [Clostridia bacterium]